VDERARSAELKQLAHDVRNALNGVAVNLEVARSRAQRGVDVKEVAPFIETAAQQLDVAARLHKRYTEAAAAVASDVASEPVSRPGPRAAAAAVLDDTHSHP
jgi:hypothetical protein